MRKSCNSSYSLIHLVKIIIRPSVVAHTYSQHSGGTGRWLSVSSRATSNRESPVTKGKKKRINRWEIWPLTMLPTHLWRMPHPLTCRQHKSTSVSKSFRKEKKKKKKGGDWRNGSMVKSICCLFQRTWPQFPALTWRLTMIQSSSSRIWHTLCFLHQLTQGAQTYMKAKHSCI